MKINAPFQTSFMKIFLRIFFVSHFLSCLLFTQLLAQPVTKPAVDTEPIEKYLRLVNSVRQNGKADPTLLNEYFSNKTVAFFMQRPGFDSIRFVNNLISVYSKHHSRSSGDNSEEILLMEKYKQHEGAIRKMISYLKSYDIQKAVTGRLAPFYEKNINPDYLKITHSYLFLSEGTGGEPGWVFNSALQTALLPRDLIDMISAHEAYHTITATLFMNKFKHIFQSSDITQAEKKFLWYLEIVAEEGIADLIDKPTLQSRRTSLYKDYLSLTKNESIRAQRKIESLDSLLSTDFPKNGKDFDISQLFDNGGHIPGRFMAQQIYKTNFQNYVANTGNPFHFFYAYNTAVDANPAMPHFSEKSIRALKQLEDRFKTIKRTSP